MGASLLLCVGMGFSHKESTGAPQANGDGSTAPFGDACGYQLNPTSDRGQVFIAVVSAHRTCIASLSFARSITRFDTLRASAYL